MTSIELQTHITAPIEICFNLSRSVELHKISTSKTHETVVAGRPAGLFQKGDTVTWRARHFGIYQTLQMEISQMLFPYSFEDRMVKGIFKSICHNHYFSSDNNVTTMRDVFQYQVPLGVLGRLFNFLVLESYMTRLLTERNSIIKEYAETGKWRGMFDVL